MLLLLTHALASPWADCQLAEGAVGDVRIRCADWYATLLPPIERDGLTIETYVRQMAVARPAITDIQTVADAPIPTVSFRTEHGVGQFALRPRGRKRHQVVLCEAETLGTCAAALASLGSQTPSTMTDTELPFSPAPTCKRVGPGDLTCADALISVRHYNVLDPSFDQTYEQLVRTLSASRAVTRSPALPCKVLGSAGVCRTLDLDSPRGRTTIVSGEAVRNGDRLHVQCNLDELRGPVLPVSCRDLFTF